MIRLRTAAGRAPKTLKSSPILSMTSTSPSVDKIPSQRPGHRLLVEGQAAIPFSEGNEVFYNKVQEFNRDLSVHVIKLFAEQRLREKEEKSLRRMRKVGTAEHTIIPFWSPRVFKVGAFTYGSGCCWIRDNFDGFGVRYGFKYLPLLFFLIRPQMWPR